MIYGKAAFVRRRLGTSACGAAYALIKIALTTTPFPTYPLSKESPKGTAIRRYQEQVVQSSWWLAVWIIGAVCRNEALLPCNRECCLPWTILGIMYRMHTAHYDWTRDTLKSHG